MYYLVHNKPSYLTLWNGMPRSSKLRMYPKENLILFLAVASLVINVASLLISLQTVNSDTHLKTGGTYCFKNPIQQLTILQNSVDTHGSCHGTTRRKSLSNLTMTVAFT